MAASTDRFIKNFGAGIVKMLGLRLSDDQDRSTANYCEIFPVTGAPSGGYGRDSGATLVAVRVDADAAATCLYVSHNGGTNWTAFTPTGAAGYDLNGTELILDADADTSITADTDDEIDIRINGADDFKLLANIFRALSGSVIETNTINETTAAAGVTIDGVLVKDGGATLTGALVVATAAGGSDMWAACPSEASASVNATRFFDDFTEARFSATQWVVTEDDAADTQTVDDALGGVLTLTCKATTDDDACQVRWAKETFRLTSGKRLWAEFYVKSSSGDMVNSDWTVGLIEAEDLTGVADNMPANGVVFHKEDGAATFSISSSDNGTNLQTAAVGTIVDATWIRIGFLFSGGASGAATITPYINGVAGTPIASVTYATMAELSAFLMVRNGDATTTQTLNCDCIKIVQER